MALIEVNHSGLREVAAAIETYCSAQDSEMRSADGEIKAMLTTDWLGPDAMEFGRKWEGVDAHDSAAGELRNALMSFGESITACADEYQSAQTDAYNEATKMLW